MALRFPSMIDFDSTSLVQIGLRFANNLDATIRWCREFGLIAETMHCPLCAKPCTQQNYSRAVDHVIWRCTVKRCKRTFNIRKGSFLEKSHLELWQIIDITYIWCRSAGSSRGLSYEDIKHELNIGSQHSAVDWNQFCRDVSVSYFINHPEPIGGPGRVVEIDESLFSKRKYEVGRLVPQQWIFGGYEPGTKKGFLIPVANRDEATLMPIIYQWILPGSIVWSDMWSAYKNLPSPAYLHGTVNHSLNFVDIQTGVTTNQIEAMWCRAKAKIKAMMGPTNREMIPDYLAEFMWAQRFSEHRFFHFWSEVVSSYPV